MSSKYEEAGVSLDKAALIAKRLKGKPGNLFTGKVDIGLSSIIATIDGVGTKSILGLELGQVRGLGLDIVHHCVNDLLCAGQHVSPSAFLDYIATNDFDVEVVLEIIDGMAEACANHGMNLIGGETADMPDVYFPGQYDIVGCAIGFMDNSTVYPRPALKAGNIAIGLYSNGLHTNGFSLVRKILSREELSRNFPGIGKVSDALLEPHKSYYHIVKKLIEDGLDITAMAHITGGGMIENVARVVPSDCQLVLTEDWPVPPIFNLIQLKGKLSLEEASEIFNMGIGMVCFAEGNFDTTMLGDHGQVIGYLERKK